MALVAAWAGVSPAALLGLLPLLLAALLPLYALYALHWSRAARLTAAVPGPRPLPLLGNAHEFSTGPVESMRSLTRMWRQHGNVFKIWLGHRAFILIAKPEMLEVFMSSNTNISKNVTYRFLHAWLGTGLLTSKGTKWKEHRKMTTPAFHFKILEDFVDTFHRSIEILIDALRPHSGGPGFDVYEYITLATLDIICETALGVSIDAQKHSESEYVTAVKGMANLVMKRSFTPWMYFDVLFNLSEDGKMQKKYLQVLHNTTRKVIQQRKQEFLKRGDSESTNNDAVGAKKKLALLDVLLESSRNGGSVTDEEIREEVDTFMFEGHDTTASGISFCLWLLGSHLDIQEKVHEEIQEIFKDSSRNATYRDLQDMKYLECVIKESLRLFPSVPVYGRELDEDVRVGDLILPAGTNVGFLAFYVHRDPEIYPNPERFDPDRFQSNFAVGRHPYAYIPFSAGPRNCIGQKFAMLKMKSVISQIIRTYRLVSVDKELELSLEIVLRSRKGFFLEIEERCPSNVLHI